MVRRRTKWWPVAAGAVVVAGATSLGGLAWHGERQADPARPAVNAAAVSARQEAWGMRLGLLSALGVALAGGAVTQWRTLSGQQRVGERPVWAVEGEAASSAGRDVDATGAPDGAVTPLWPVAPALMLVDMRASARWTPALTPAEAHCARAIDGAHAYNRAGTVAAFSAALAADPEVKPANLAGFWEMPAGGHADLARAYLRFGRRLDARSVLTVAALAFGPNRELELLQRELAEDDWREAERPA